MKDQTRKWGKRMVYFAVFGVTGVVCLIAYNLYRVSQGIGKIDLDDLKL